MQATCKGKQEWARKTEGGHTKRCENKQKKMLARKTVQKRKKTDVDTQNDAMQEKANAGTQNVACNANGNAMDAMQCFRWAYPENLRPDLR